MAAALVQRDNTVIHEKVLKSPFLFCTVGLLDCEGGSNKKIQHQKPLFRETRRSTETNENLFWKSRCIFSVRRDYKTAVHELRFFVLKKYMSRILLAQAIAILATTLLDSLGKIPHEDSFATRYHTKSRNELRSSFERKTKGR